MPTAVIAANVTGTLDQADKRAMLLIVNRENARRAVLVPPGTPLLVGTNTEIRNSYEEVQSALLVSAHLDYVKQSDVASLSDIRNLWDAATDTQRNNARTALGG
jgi:hypothetical protein